MRLTQDLGAGSRAGEAVVIIDADEFQRLTGKRTGQWLIDALQASPHRHIQR